MGVGSRHNESREAIYEVSYIASPPDVNKGISLEKLRNILDDIAICGYIQEQTPGDLIKQIKDRL